MVASHLLLKAGRHWPPPAPQLQFLNLAPHKRPALNSGVWGPKLGGHHTCGVLTTCAFQTAYLMKVEETHSLMPMTLKMSCFALS